MSNTEGHHSMLPQAVSRMISTHVLLWACRHMETFTDTHKMGQKSEVTRIGCFRRHGRNCEWAQKRTPLPILQHYNIAHVLREKAITTLAKTGHLLEMSDVFKNE